MKRYMIALLALTVTVAHARKVYVVTPLNDGHGSYSVSRPERPSYSVSRPERPTDIPRGDELYAGDAPPPRAYVSEEVTITNDLVEPPVVETVTNAIPIPHNQCKWTEGMDAPEGMTQAELDARAADHAAQEAARLQAIAVEDATTYSNAFVAIAALTTVVTNISAGVDSMPVIQGKALAAFNAAMQGGDTTTALTINGYSTAAANAYQGVLKPVGIVGERFWRAMAAWSGALKAEMDD